MREQQTKPLSQRSELGYGTAGFGGRSMHDLGYDGAQNQPHQPHQSHHYGLNRSQGPMMMSGGMNGGGITSEE